MWSSAKQSIVNKTELNNIAPHHHTTIPFYGPFSRTTRVSRCQKRISGLYDAREDNRCRHTNRLAGCHSIRTNQCLPPPSPIFFKQYCTSTKIHCKKHIIIIFFKFKQLEWWWMFFGCRLHSLSAVPWRAAETKLVSMASPVTSLMRLPMFWISSVVCWCHVLAVSTATG